MERYAGTEETVGGVVVAVDYDEITVEKDGRRIVLRQERDWGYCYCEQQCTCKPTVYLRAVEILPDPPKSKK